MIFYHHIGGRNGTFPLPIKKGPLLQDIHLILYDADPKCLEHMEEKVEREFKKVSVLPYCIGSQSGDTYFNITFHPTNSSLYIINDLYKEHAFVPYPRYGEYIFGEGFKVEKQINVSVITLEDALRKGNLSIDYLSLDVQGAEYDVLAGSQNIIAENVVGIQLEVEFIDLYKNQKVFSDLDVLMKKMDFELIDLNSVGRASPMSLPIGFRAEEQVIYADLVYIKKYDSIKESNDIEKMYKYAVFALINKQMGLCLKMLKHIREIQIPMKSTSKYQELLVSLMELFEHRDNIYLPKFHEIFTQEMVKNFYTSSLNKKDLSKDQKERNLFLRNSFLGCIQRVKYLQNTNTTSVEELLYKYGLDYLAGTIKLNRNREAKIYLDLIESLRGKS